MGLIVAIMTLMGIARRATGLVRAPMRRVLAFYVRFFEDLIHAVKSELVGRFDASDQHLNRLEVSIDSGHDTLSQQLALQAAAVRRLQADIERLQESTDVAMVDDIGAARDELAAIRKDLAERLDQLTPSARLQELMGARLSDIDAQTSWFLNYVGSHAGPLADAGWWINHPIVIEWGERSVQLGAVNERIIEQPFVFAAVADLLPGSRILDVGGAESTVGFSLASLGYDVTVIEPQGYPFEHPNLTVFEAPLEEYLLDEPFDAVILLSTIEHFGIGHYQGGPEPDPDADLVAMDQIAGMMAPAGRLVLTTPYGPSETNELERVYDRDRLLQLLDGWTINHAVIGRRLDRTTWVLESTQLVDPAGPGRVVMVMASVPEGP